mmetsp:Transcript_28445/g.32525  ORF Transcript_28445/g.32525 Transcript_28445/m.32525 type:complete len:148 (-) Transcript_28445:637-1080(-)
MMRMTRAILLVVLLPYLTSTSAFQGINVLSSAGRSNKYDTTRRNKNFKKFLTLEMSNTEGGNNNNNQATIVVDNNDGNDIIDNLSERAVKEFKMITEDESKIRQIGGIFVGMATLASYFSSSDVNYSALSAEIATSIALYRTGADYQ